MPSKVLKWVLEVSYAKNSWDEKSLKSSKMSVYVYRSKFQKRKPTSGVPGTTLPRFNAALSLSFNTDIQGRHDWADVVLEEWKVPMEQ